MERNGDTTSFYGRERGAGGKFRKPPSRRQLPSPYARPPQNEAQRNRWLSRLVDPACRLLYGGATRILPSFFAKSPLGSLPAPEDKQQEEDHDNLDREHDDKAGGDEYCDALNHMESISTGPAGPTNKADGSRNASDSNRGEDHDGLSEIEQLMKGKTFSRDEINRLIQIVQSKAVDLSDVDQENMSKHFTARVDAFENPRISVVEKQEDVNKAQWGTSTPLRRSFMPDEVGASPIDIARAYMGSRTSEVSPVPKSTFQKDDRTSLNGDEFAPRPFIPSTAPKPSTCWPGAMLQERGYLTPQNERGRVGLHNLPRTPYSRSIFSKSKSKQLTQLQSNGNRSQNHSFTPLQQSQTRTLGQTRRNTLENGRGSVGPIRRMRHKSVADSPFNRSVSSRSYLDSPQPVGNSSALGGFLPTANENFEPVATSSSVFQSGDRKPVSSEVGVPTVHPHSSQMARTILEHLERNPPTPKDKSTEINRATLWRRHQSSNVANLVSSGHNTSLHNGGPESSKNRDQADNKNYAKQNEDRVNSFFVVPKENTKNTEHAIAGPSSATLLKGGSNNFTVPGVSTAGRSQDLMNSQIKSGHENEKTGPDVADEEAPNSQRNKPVLSSISIGKPDQKWTLSSNNSFGFTFPVSSSSGVSSEPPTPSIMPSSSATTGTNQLKETPPPVPSYSFGLNRSTPPLTFTFSSTGTAPTQNDASDIKFNFGSDKLKRISFSSVGKDAICSN